MDELNAAIYKMQQRIVNILDFSKPSIYLYGSVVLDDFKPGWSDIDILVLTQEPISEEQANQLVLLRQALLTEEPANPYYRAFEGGMLSLNAFLSGTADRVVYWGTSGQRIARKYDFDAFCMCQLLDSAVLLYGNDVRSCFAYPSFDALKANVQRHYEAVRKYAQKTDRSLYSYGWLLDISRCIYTLRTGKILPKTAAGEWALHSGICPCPDALGKAVAVRKEPCKYKQDVSIMDYAETLGDCVQSYADVLECELKGSN